jgi:glucose/arabinose dehydrogenase
MKTRYIILILVIVAALVGAFFLLTRERATLPETALYGPTPTFAAPKRTLLPTINVAKAVGWSGSEAPKPAAALKVNGFAAGLSHPRWLTVLPNGDVLVAEANSPPRKVSGVQDWVMGQLLSRAGAGAPSVNRITLLRDADGDGVAESRSVLLAGLHSPTGMALVGDHLYVANTDAVVRYPFKPGETRITAKPEKIVALPGGGNHWARNLIVNEDGSKLYVTVGSSTNIAENGLPSEEGRAAIWEIDTKTKSHRIYAYGLRNANGLAWEPATKTLWTVVNERDMLGSDLVPDYLTSVQFGGFYGWPWYYWGGYVDKRVPEPDDDLREYVVRPDYALGSHTAALGLAFAGGAKLGAFREGAFVALHGSWNRKPLAGYKVIFVPFAKGGPKGKPIDILTGFLDSKEHARGRPVGLAIDRTGALLVADDVGNRVWRVSAKPTASRTASPGPGKP